MNILAIETAAAKPSVGIIDGNGEIVMISSAEELNHLQNLIPMIDEVLRKTGTKLPELSAIAVSIGPGSFTGIRIGISTVKALAQLDKLKIIPVPSLLSMAYSIKDKNPNLIICPMIDARRGQVYGGAFKWKDDDLEEIIPCKCYLKDDLMTIVQDFATVLEADVLLLNEEIQSAKLIGELALKIFKDDGGKNLYEIHPDYMRLAEAEQKLQDKGIK
ncbi:MAG: tRNA (adenosine(37)-N6)-threonylcarbamoyltransferase complex dimerization subunit type 1 TsaB [Eubacteriales bacterium]